MNFFDKTDDEIYEKIGNNRSGCYPISNKGFWHSGIHVFFDTDNEPVINPLEGKIISCNVDKNKNWNYFVLKNIIKLPSKGKKEQGYNCYNIIGNLKSDNEYEDLINKENDFSEQNLTKIENLPFYVHASVKLCLTKNTDPNNYKFFFKSLNNDFYLDYTNKAIKQPGINVNNCIELENKYLPCGTNLISKITNKEIGTLNENITLINSKVKTGTSPTVSIQGSNIKLSKNVPTGLYILNIGESINPFANIRINDKESCVLWKEESKISDYVGFGLVLQKSKTYWVNIENKLFDKLSEETKKNINDLITSQDNKCDTLILLSEGNTKNIFPYKIMNKNEAAYKITDKNGNIIKPLSIKNSEYLLIEKELIGFFKDNKIYKSYSDLWKDCNISYTKYEPIKDSLIYKSDFEYLKVITDDGKDYTDINKIPSEQRNSIIQKVRFYLLNATEKDYYVDKDEVFSKVINISDKKGIYKFSETTIINNFPASEIIDIGAGTIDVEIENTPEVLKNIKDGKSYIWIKNNGGFFFLSKSQYSSLKFSLVKTTPKKDDVIQAGQILGFPYSRQVDVSKNEIAALPPYIDYVLFFDEDITCKKTTLFKISVKKDTKAIIEKQTFNKTEDFLICPPWGKIETETIVGVKEYVRLVKIKFEIYAYPGQVENTKIKPTCNSLWICNFPVVVENGIIVKIRDDYKSKVFSGDSEKINQLIEMLNKCYTKMKTKSLIFTKDSKSNPVYLYNCVLDFSSSEIIIKNNFERGNVCKYIETFISKKIYEETVIPEDYTTTLTDKEFSKIIIDDLINLQLRDNIYYLSITSVQKEDLLSFIHENSESLNFGKKALISDSKILPNNQLFIPKDKMNDFRQSYANLLSSKTDSDGNTLDTYVYKSSKDIPHSNNSNNDESDFVIYRSDKNYSILLKTYLNKLLCYHPLEWDKSLYDNIKVSGRDIEPFSDSDCDIATDIGTSKKKYYFVNPIFFYQNMEMLGLLFHNPYEGKTYKDIYNTGNGVCKGIDMNTKIVDNPGFAPIYDGVQGRVSVEEFAGTNGFFNEDYGNVHSTYKQYWHEGVDFAGTKDTVIKSLIFGEVIDVGTHKKVHDGTGMGDYMIVQDAYDKNKYYLLLHLAYESWKKYNISIGTKVYPGMKVAGVGKQDYSETAYHLHISVAVLLPSEKAIPEDDKKGPVIIRDSNYLFPIWGYNAKMRDPFNHKITWKGRS